MDIKLGTVNPKAAQIEAAAVGLIINLDLYVKDPEGSSTSRIVPRFDG